MKNHYIPQFIIKKFSKTINVFNLKTGELKENESPHSVFYGENIYEDEVEKLLNLNLEAEFSKLLDKKLLINDNKIELTRKELLLVKRYMLVSSVRTQGEEEFRDFLVNFKRNTYMFYTLNQQFEKSSLPYTEETTLSNRELFNNALLAFSQTISINDLAFNPLCTREMVAYAATFLLSYIAFWDAPEGNEFVLSDVGMISEYEGVHQITGGLDLSKLSYLFHQLLNDKSMANIYIELLSSNEVMYENYDIFNISKKRCLIMINPFFRQYFGMHCGLFDKNYAIFTDLPIPDMWPAIIQNKNLFTPPINEYKKNPCVRKKTDRFIYESRKLNQEELVYINSMLISQSKELIGFDSAKMVFPSIEFAINQNCWFKSVTKENSNNNNYEKLCNYFLNAINEPLMKFAMWCQKNNDVEFIDIDKLFNNYITNIYKDFKTNIYIFEYLLSKKVSTYNCKELDFLGKGNKDEKMKFIEKEYNRLKEEQNKLCMIK